MSSSCYFRFNENALGVYFGGQPLSGTIELITHKTKIIKNVFIAIDGRAKCQWSENDSNNRQTTYSAKEIYIKFKQNVIQPKVGASLELPPGKHEFTFNLVLPPELPSSYQGAHGEIKYDISCHIERSMTFNNVFRQPFTVLSILDLNLYPFYRQPVNKVKLQKFSSICCCGNGGKIHAEGFIGQNGFVPGQSFFVKFKAKSMTNIRCHQTYIQFMKRTQYNSDYPRKKTKIDLFKIQEQPFGELEPFGEKELQTTFTVPAMPPSTLNKCRIIDVSYHVVAEFKTFGVHKNLYLYLPITIGTIPIALNIETQAMTENLNTVQPISNEPPTYEEATAFGESNPIATDENDHMPPVNYTPKYPVYHNFQPPIHIPGELTNCPVVVVAQPGPTLHHPEQSSPVPVVTEPK